MLGRRPSDPSTRAPPPAAILNLFPGRRGISPPPQPPPPAREPISPIMAPTPTIPTSPSVGRGRLHRGDGRGQQRHYHLTPPSASVRPSSRAPDKSSVISFMSIEESVFAGPASPSLDPRPSKEEGRANWGTARRSGRGRSAPRCNHHNSKLCQTLKVKRPKRFPRKGERAF